MQFHRSSHVSKWSWRGTLTSQRSKAPSGFKIFKKVLGWKVQKRKTLWQTMFPRLLDVSSWQILSLIVCYFLASWPKFWCLLYVPLTFNLFSFHSIVYGALLTKTNRISRIFNASKQSAKRPSFITPKSQLIICLGIVLVQILVNVIWFLILPPEAIHHHPTREDNLLVCKVGTKKK